MTQNNYNDITNMQKLDLFGNPISKQNYRDYVKKILVKHNLYKIPIDVYSLAEKENFTICTHTADKDGFILINTIEKIPIGNMKYEQIISLQMNQPIGRTRFTLAHELGHYYLEYLNSDNKEFFAQRDESIISNQAKETHINNFASELLMPYDLLKSFILNFSIKKKYTLDDPILIAAVAKAFNTSASAAEVRLNKLAWENA